MSAFLVPDGVRFTTVLSVRREGEAYIRQAKQAVLSFDLSALYRYDSALLSCLCCWMRAAKKQRKTLVFVEVPASLLAAARLYGLLPLLPFSTRAPV